jgi:hypothetical protein
MSDRRNGRLGRARLCVTALSTFAILTAGAASRPAVAADRAKSVEATAAATKTSKERLSDKASDEQRTNDCHVPQSRRTRARPANCP